MFSSYSKKRNFQPNGLHALKAVFRLTSLFNFCEIFPVTNGCHKEQTRTSCVCDRWKWNVSRSGSRCSDRGTCLRPPTSSDVVSTKASRTRSAGRSGAKCCIWTSCAKSSKANTRRCGRWRGGGHPTYDR